MSRRAWKSPRTSESAPPRLFGSIFHSFISSLLLPTGEKRPRSYSKAPYRYSYEPMYCTFLSHVMEKISHLPAPPWVIDYRLLCFFGSRQ